MTILSVFICNSFILSWIAFCFIWSQFSIKYWPIWIIAAIANPTIAAIAMNCPKATTPAIIAGAKAPLNKAAKIVRLANIVPTNIIIGPSTAIIKPIAPTTTIIPWANLGCSWTHSLILSTTSWNFCTTGSNNGSSTAPSSPTVSPIDSLSSRICMPKLLASWAAKPWAEAPCLVIS